MQENTNFERKSILLHTRIGLEIHITTDSKKKVFNFNDTYKGTESNNSLVGSWELGYLGVLPLVNPEVIALGLKLALALKMKEISKVIEFDRKIYTFPDLPIGYQITQNTNPLARNGSFRTVISQENFFDVFVRSLQIEADTARSIHEGDQTYLDFNRSGNPLIELVTEPCFKTAEEVTSFLEQLQTLLVYLDISEAKMEKGQFRVDLNLSFFANEIDYSTPRYEIKNLNSLKNIKECLEFET